MRQEVNCCHLWPLWVHCRHLMCSAWNFSTSLPFPRCIQEHGVDIHNQIFSPLTVFVFLWSGQADLPCSGFDDDPCRRHAPKSGPWASAPAVGRDGLGESRRAAAACFGTNDLLERHHSLISILYTHSLPVTTTDLDTRDSMAPSTLDLFILTFNCAKNLIDPSVFASHLHGTISQNAGLPDLVVL